MHFDQEKLYARCWHTHFEDLFEQWKTSTREGRVYARAADEHPHLTCIIERLAERGLAFVFERFDDRVVEQQANRLFA